MTQIKNKIFLLLPYIIGVFLIIDFYLIFVHAPEENVQGLVQKIFYFHVSTAFAMYFGFALAGLFSFLYLLTKNDVWDAASRAGATAGLLFCTMVLVSGPIWAKPIWGTWWTWDPRLTTTLLIWLIFTASLLLRKFFEGDPRGKLYASVMTLFGVLDIPLIFFSVKLWRGIHPSVLGKDSNMPKEMLIALIFTNITILILLFGLMWIQKRVYVLEDKILSLKLKEN